MTVTLGVDRFAQGRDPSVRTWRRARLGLVTNDVALTSDLRPARTVLLGAGYPIVRLFSPEHGLSAQGRDGEGQADTTDVATGLPVVSLYGERFAPAASDLEGLDAVVLDLTDVGCRFYTYLWTTTHVMEACAARGLPLVVLDRPNPIGGRLSSAEGPMLDEATCASFVGRWRIPLRHCLTIGELARHWQCTRLPGLDLHVVALDGWARDDIAAGSAAPWIPTSPGIPTAETALLYPGTGLIEGVNVSEGRGTALPFRAIGAPWIDGRALAWALEPERERGLAAVPYSFTPSAGEHAGQRCDGVLLTVTRPAEVRPVAVGVRLIAAIAELAPDRLRARAYRTAANPTGAAHLDRLLGVPDALDLITSGAVDDAFLHVPGWADEVADALLY